LAELALNYFKCHLSQNKMNIILFTADNAKAGCK
jgi:hypothetical protein